MTAERLGYFMDATEQPYKFKEAKSGFFKFTEEEVEYINEELNTMHLKLEAAQTQIDALMLEYCPDEMTDKQKANWAEHQRTLHEEVIEDAYNEHTGWL